MRRRFMGILYICTVFLTFGSIAGATGTLCSVRALGMGGAGVGLSGGLSEVMIHNPALLTTASSGLDTFYANSYSFPGYIKKNFGFKLSIKKLHLGLRISNESAILLQYNENEVVENHWGDRKNGFGLGLKLNENLSLGGALWSNENRVSTDYDQQGVSGIEKNWYGTFGFSYEKKNFGFSIVADELKSLKPSQIRTGFKVGKPETIIGNAEVKYELESRLVNYYAGIEASLAPNFAIRIGVDQVGMFSVGFSLAKGSLKFDYAYRIHPIGDTHYLGTGYYF